VIFLVQAGVCPYCRPWFSNNPPENQVTASPDGRVPTSPLIEYEWYIVPKADLKMVLKHASAMRGEIAARLHIPVDEMRCVKVEEPVEPMEAIQMIPHSVWRVSFEAPDWSEPVMIRIQVVNTTYRRSIMKRQSLYLLEERLCDMPGRDENTLWFRPDKVKVDAEVSLFEWREEEILTIIQKQDGMIPVEMSFRHTNISRSTHAASLSFERRHESSSSHRLIRLVVGGFPPLGPSNNNNTFTWSSPSGVLGCTGQRR
jgi:hypothetical protein